MTKKYSPLLQKKFQGRYGSLKRAKDAARRNAPALGWGQTLEIIRYSDGTLDWMVNTDPLPLPQGAVCVASFSRTNRRWTNYVPRRSPES